MPTDAHLINSMDWVHPLHAKQVIKEFAQNSVEVEKVTSGQSTNM